MRENKRLAPKRRFKEFQNAGDWEQRELKEILKVNSGRDYKHLGSGSIPVYGTGGYMLSVNDKLSDKDAIGIGRKGTIDKPQYLKAPFWTVDTLFFMIPLNNFDLQFLYTMTQKINWKKMDESTGVPSLSKAVIEKVNQNIPSYQEQIKIGGFFKQLDNTIALHQRKLQKLKAIKSSYLYEMFPNEGEKRPKRRFSGFNEDWEEHRLGNLTKIKTGSSDLKDADENGKYPLFVRSENVERSNRYIFDGEAILIPGEGRLGEIYHYIDGKFDFHQRVYKISDFVDSNTDGKFVLYELQKNFKKHALKYTVKATVDSLRLPMLTEYEIKIPGIDEQRKISSFFWKIDRLIDLQQEELGKLKSIKVAYLNEMFV